MRRGGSQTAAPAISFASPLIATQTVLNVAESAIGIPISDSNTRRRVETSGYMEAKPGSSIREPASARATSPMRLGSSGTIRTFP